tara:strand:+ start:408 stop:887 length:480 start_codon:yes stop_codon:yes gene_type:complete
VVRERIKEVVDFARAESPYRNANKGWINDDVYLQWGSLPDQSEKNGNELIDIFIFWKPFGKLISILFSVISISVIVVLLAVSFSQGKINISMPTPPIAFEQTKVEVLNNIETAQEVDNEIISEQDLNTVEVTPIKVLEVQEEPLQKNKQKPVTTAGNLF